MDFESPDVEKEFPGLYASDAGKKSNESDFSDEGVPDKHSKKDLLGGKKKDKKEKKDRGYATLEGESSPDEEQETKSPKAKFRPKAFKFSSRKDKSREKSREKDALKVDKEPDNKEKKKKDKDIDKDAEKEKRKDKDKSKHKLKTRKKSKHGDDPEIINEPIFGVSLSLAVERSRCHDGVSLPLVVRDCIDHLEENGMQVEGLYKVPGNKSKIQHLKKSYNQRESVKMSDYEPSTAAGLLLAFLKELPEPVLESSDLISKFEQAASNKDLAQRETLLCELTNQQLSECNRVLLAWVTLHLDHVTANEKTTKMNAQAIAMALSPVLQMSHRLLLAFLLHCKSLFPNVKLKRYIPPLPASGLAQLPETPEAIMEELSKQESLLAQCHALMNAGYVNKTREEQLWEVQRIVTQLKRKNKLLQKREGSTQKSIDGEEAMSQFTDSQSNKSVTVTEDGSDCSRIERDQKDETDNIKSSPPKSEEVVVAEDEEDQIERLRETFTYYELLNVQSLLRTRIAQERQEIEKLVEMLQSKLLTNQVLVSTEDVVDRGSPSEAEMTAMIQLDNENQLLEKKLTTLIKSIVEEKDICVKLRVELTLQQYLAAQQSNANNGVR